jgi:hypothetical protein
MKEGILKAPLELIDLSLLYSHSIEEISSSEDYLKLQSISQELQSLCKESVELQKRLKDELFSCKRDLGEMGEVVTNLKTILMDDPRGKAKG